MWDGHGRSEIIPILDFLESYVVEHFSYEEACMEKYQCPIAGKNKKAHEYFVNNFMSLKSRFNQEGPSSELALVMQRELSEWLVKHIKGIDTELDHCLPAHAKRKGRLS